jgi:RES domain-containing protein
VAPRASDEGAAREVFRHCGPQHTDLDQTLAHAETVGGHYNPPAEFGAIYASATRADALRELHRSAERLGLERGDLLPRVLLTLELRVEKLLDLTDEGVREAWGVQLEDLLHDTDYSRCHEIARSARRAGYEAIRFPAFDRRGVNYAIFLDRLKPGSSLRSISEESLDRAGQDRRSPGGG